VQEVWVERPQILSGAFIYTWQILEIKTTNQQKVGGGGGVQC
jgi:hypothetical protein